MPDPTHQTVSASQAAALFNASPWCTRWMLWKHFHDGIKIDPEEDARMSWGKKLEPLIIQQAAEDLRLEVIPNGDTYVRRGLLGCTRDAVILCPDRGPGALETKAIFDYRTWMTDWGGGAFVPRHHEIQLQTQMMVGLPDAYDGRRLSSIQPPSFGWGIIAAWVAGEVHYFERKPLPDLWHQLENAASHFFASIACDEEPEPFGAPVEVPWLTQLFPCERGKTVDLSDNPELAEVAIQYRDAKEQEAGGKAASEPLRAKLLAAAKDVETMLLFDGVNVTVRPHGKGKRIKVYTPTDAAAADFMMGG
jgi:hypothetical protein